MNQSPMRQLADAVRQNGLIRFMEHFEELFPAASSHLKDLVVENIGPDRAFTILGRTVVNFGSDSFLGLDQDPRVKEAIKMGVERWGAHNGASRAFASVQANIDAEEKLAQWLGTEATLIYPSVTLANMGAIPGLVGRQDLLIVDEQAHNSIQEGAKIARANGCRVETFSHCDPVALRKVLDGVGSYRVAVVAIDGVYSMSGELPPLAALNNVCLDKRAVLYVDDAHASGVVGPKGRGTVLSAVGSYDNVLVVGSLSKGFSCAGAFIGCTAEFKRLLKMKSNTYIFGGPVVPPYLEAVCTVCDILMSEEYEALIARLHGNMRRLTNGPAPPEPDRAGGQGADRVRAGRRRGGHAQRRAVSLRAGILRPVGDVPRGAVPRRRLAHPG